MLRPTGGAALARLRRQSGAPPWQLRCLPVCASTEQVLSDWLRLHPWDGLLPRAVIARRQTLGQGQWGRRWQSPPGGVWLSAALPWSAPSSAPGILGLAVAVALAERLEASGVAVLIKWPNDLLVQGRKLAGVLPRMVVRGNKVRLARVGVGLNLVNAVPPGGIALTEVLAIQRGQQLHWTAEVLAALDHAISLVADPERVCHATEMRLWTRQVQDPRSGEQWSVEGVAEDGALRLRQGTRTNTWTRWEDASFAGL